MIRLLARLTMICALTATSAAVARTAPPETIPAPSALCRSAIVLAERATRVPDRLLDAISIVESGRKDPLSRAVYAWPWTINAEGVGHFYDTKAEAIAAAQAFQARGIASIDVGCAQVNLFHHPDAFATLDQAFDPVQNTAYAAHFLQRLFAQTNAWPLAAAAYHSFTPDLGADYARKVLAVWGMPQLAVQDQRITPSAAANAVEVAQAPPGRVAVMLPTGNDAIRVISIGNHPVTNLPIVSRGLDAYRAQPIMASNRRGRPS